MNPCGDGPPTGVTAVTFSLTLGQGENDQPAGHGMYAGRLIVWAVLVVWAAARDCARGQCGETKYAGPMSPIRLDLRPDRL